MSFLQRLLPFTLLAGCQDPVEVAREQQAQLAEKIQSDGNLSPQEFSGFIRKHDLRLREYQAIQAGIAVANSSASKRELGIVDLDCSKLDNGHLPRVCSDTSWSVLYDDLTGEVVRQGIAERYERVAGVKGYFWAVDGRSDWYSLLRFTDESLARREDVVAGPFLRQPMKIMEGKNGPIWYGVTKRERLFEDAADGRYREYKGVTGLLFTKNGPINGTATAYTAGVYDDITDPNLFTLTLADVLRQPGLPTEFMAAIQKYQTDNNLPFNAEVLVIRKPHAVPSFGSQMDTHWTSSGIFNRSGQSTSISSTVANNSQSAWYGALSPDGEWIVYTWPESQNMDPDAMASTN